MSFIFEIEGTYTHPNDLNEHTVVEIDPAGEAIIPHNFELDCTALTRATVFRFYREIGGVYRRREGDGTDGGEQTYTPGASSPLLFFWMDSATQKKTKVTAETTGILAEGATRAVPYQYGYEA